MGAFGAKHQVTTDLTGHHFGSLVVTERAENLHDGSSCWIVRCPAGHLTSVRGRTLRHNERQGGETKCRICDPTWNAAVRETKPFVGVRSPRHCRACRSTGHSYATCPERERPKRRYCDDCSNLPHRREAPECPGCGEPHVPETLPGILDVVASMRAPSREVVF
jgi:hypothetical protein